MADNHGDDDARVIEHVDGKFDNISVVQSGGISITRVLNVLAGQGPALVSVFPATHQPHFISRVAFSSPG
jgi:hypothetical protein